MNKRELECLRIFVQKCFKTVCRLGLYDAARKTIPVTNASICEKLMPEQKLDYVSQGWLGLYLYNKFFKIMKDFSWSPQSIISYLIRELVFHIQFPKRWIL